MKEKKSKSKLKPKDIQMLLIIVGLLAVFLSYKFVFTSLNEKTTKVEKENETLQKKVDDLRDKKENQLMYSSKMTEDEKEAEEVLSKIPQGFQVESNIEYLTKLIKKTDVTISSVSYEPVGAYYNFVAADKKTTEGQPIVSATKVTCAFKSSYKSLKRMVEVINEEYNRTRIEDISCNASPDSGGLSGTVVFTAYSSDSSEIGREYKKPKFKVKTGKSNGIFDLEK